ncbi:MAG: RsmD family RNA methyltransferase [Bacteroidales bacterium]|jgi:16S rRNA (guanine(966)-N(2))-methyltransferase RsmD|nr:RsmD family RNA methyltransferase [Bacteroidales bacterium]
MRIISGLHRGKKIVAPLSLPVRPTTDFAKESLFNILNNYFYPDKIKVLDLFAGTGNISYEFAARQAISVTAVDNYQPCVNFIKRTAQQLNFENITSIKADAVAFLLSCRQQYNVIFADPPYTYTDYAAIVDAVFEKERLLPDGFLIIEHSAVIDFSQDDKFYQQRNYGKVNFSIFAQNL